MTEDPEETSRPSSDELRKCAQTLRIRVKEIDELGTAYEANLSQDELEDMEAEREAHAKTARFLEGQRP